MAVLALECSTSAAKAIVCDQIGMMLSTRELVFGSSISDIATQEPEGVAAKLFECGRKAVADAGHPIEAIALCGIWHSLLLLDSARKPLMPIWTWANTQAKSITKQMRFDRILERSMYHKTGCVIHSKYGLWQLKYIKENFPDIFSKCKYISNQHSYIYERLTGRWVVSRTTASGSGFLNLKSGDWEQDALAIAGITSEYMPELTEMDTTFPLIDKAAKELGLPSGIPVAIGGADGALNQIGSGALGSKQMTFSVGTSAALRITTSQLLLPEEPSTWCYWLRKGEYIIGGATAGAGSCINWFRDCILSGEMTIPQLEKAMGKTDRREAPYFLPFIYGEQCPGGKDDRYGEFVKLTGKHSVGDLYYGLLEGILFNLYQCYLILVQLADKPERVLISGGITRSLEWLQMTADIFDVQVSLSDVTHASTMGAAVLALTVAGHLDSSTEFKASVKKTIRPIHDHHKLYNNRYLNYLWYYNHNNGSCSQANQSFKGGDT